MNAFELSGGEDHFICDVMLGRLARWLRLLGYDTLYRNDATDRDLVHIALEEGRILLTRDTRISSRGGLSIVRIRSNNVQDQLRQVVGELNLRQHPELFRRCSLCNMRLHRISPAQAEGLAPDYILSRHRSFSFCPVCRRVYWSGSHRRNMLRALKRSLPRRPPLTHP